MTSTSLNSVQIYLQQAVSKEHFTPANFGECIVDHFGFAQEGEGYVVLTHEENRIKLERPPLSQPSKAVLLRHAVECPVYKYSKNTEKPLYLKEIQDRGIGVGVVVLLTSSDQHVLVTRRAPHMRTFPGVWVPPGGHIEEGESISKAGIRELREETGILCEDSSHQILCLWESVYPHRLELGDPIRQHLVIYIAIQSSLSHIQLSKVVKLDPDETDAALWLPMGFVEKISTGQALEQVPSTLSLIQQNDGNTEEIPFETAPVIDAIAPPPGATAIEIDRITWGTRFALRQWLSWVQSNNASSAKL